MADILQGANGMWQAQMNSGDLLEGGTGSVTDVNVSDVQPLQVISFDVVTDMHSLQSYNDYANSVETWYLDGDVYTPTFPFTQTMNDGTTLTVARNSDAVGDLLYTQA